MDDLKDKVAVVTGAGSGIGLGVATALAEAGCHVVLADIDDGSAREAASDVARLGVQTQAASVDVSDRDSVEALAAGAWSTFGHVDIVVNNAGVFPGIAPLVDVDEWTARWVLDVNIMGVWHGLAAFAPRFVEQGTPAHIVCTGSEHSLGMAHTGAAVYTASKHAVLGMCDVLRRELPGFVGVSILCPGAVRTNLSSSGVHRQERFGGPTSAGPSMRFGMDPHEVGLLAVAGMRRGDFYIVTHPHVREIVEERAEEAAAAFAAQTTERAGAGGLSAVDRYSVHLR